MSTCCVFHHEIITSTLSNGLHTVVVYEVNRCCLHRALGAAVMSGVATESVGKRRGQPLVREGEASASSVALTA